MAHIIVIQIMKCNKNDKYSTMIYQQSAETDNTVFDTWAEEDKYIAVLN